MEAEVSDQPAEATDNTTEPEAEAMSDITPEQINEALVELSVITKIYPRHQEAARGAINLITELKAQVAALEAEKERYKIALINLAKSPQGFTGYWKDYASAALKQEEKT